MSPIKTAVIGFGLSGEFFHSPIINALPELELSAVLSRQSDKVRASYPNARVYQDLEALLADPELELVVITAPNEQHFPMAKTCLEAGKHLVVEKPFVVESEQGEALIQLASEKGLCLSAYHNRRFDGDFLTIRELLQSGRLGEIHSFYASFNRYRPDVRDRWREADVPGAGLLFDLGPHLIDQALQLFGKPSTVTASVHKKRPGSQVDDHFHLLLGYPNLEVTLHADCLSVNPDPRYRIAGSLGQFEKSGLDPQEGQLRSGLAPGAAGWGVEDPANHGLLSLADGEAIRHETLATRDGCYQEYYRQMAAAIRQQGKLPVNPEEALDVIRVIEAAFESAEHSTTVQLG